MTTERQALIADLVRRNYKPALDLLLCFQGLDALTTEGLRLVGRVLDLIEARQRPEHEDE